MYLTTIMNLTTMSLKFSCFVKQSLFLLIRNRMTTCINPLDALEDVHFTLFLIFEFRPSVQILFGS